MAKYFWEAVHAKTQEEATKAHEKFFAAGGSKADWTRLVDENWEAVLDEIFIDGDAIG